MKRITIILPALFLALYSCKPGEDPSDAYGNFEADELMVSAESQGRILELKAEEGTSLGKDQVVALIDTSQLHLQKLQLESGRASLHSRILTLEAQVNASSVQLENLVREKERIDQMAEGGAATSKQQDDIEGQVALLEAQIAATRTQAASVHAERRTLEVRIDQVEDQLEKCRVRAPIDGVVLTRYKQQGEIAVPGQALFKMARLDELILRAYISGDQLSSVKVGQQVTVLHDGAGGIEEVPGRVSWISSRAEFTPKIIQTREERVNLVYAVKVVVGNDGGLKIGMPGEIRF